MKPDLKQQLGHIIEKTTTGKAQVDCLVSNNALIMKYLVPVIILKGRALLG